ncbi:unnamed protein product [Closterium sp. NIES-53]
MGPAPSGVSQVDAVEPVEVAVDSGAATGAEPAGAGSGGAGSGGAETEGAEPGGAATGGAEPGGAETGSAEPWGAATGGTEPGGAEPGGAEPGGAGSARVASRGASPRREVLSPRELREWFARRWSRATGAGGPPATTGSGGTGPGGAGAAGPGGTAEAAGVGPPGGSAGVSGGTGAAGSAGPVAAGATRVGAAGGVGAGSSADAGPSEGAGAGAAGAGGATGAGAPARSPGAVLAGSGGAPRPRPYFVPLLEQVLGLPPSPSPAPPFECRQPIQSQSLLQPVSLLPAPSPYTGPTRGLAERRAPASCPASPARPACTGRRTSRPRPPAVPGTHQMALRPSTAPLRVPLPSPPASSLPTFPDPESDSLRAANPTVARFLATVVTDPSLASTTASALVAELVDFAASCRLVYAASLVAESASVCPPSVGGECALSTDVLEDRQEEFQCFAAALPHLVSTLLAPEGDPDAPDIPTPRSYAEAIEGTYVDEVPPPGANIVSGMWIFSSSLGVSGVLQRFDFTYSSPQATPLSTRHSLSALPSDESVEPSGPYPELVGCLMYLMTCTRPHLAYPLSILARYVAPGRHRPEHMAAAKRVLRYLCSTSGMGLVLGGRRPVVLTGHADASWADDQATQRSSQGYTFSLGSGSVSWRSTRSSSVLSSSCEGEIYAGAMAAQELRWLTYLLTNLGEQPRSPPVLYVDNKAMLALCREHSIRSASTGATTSSARSFIASRYTKQDTRSDTRAVLQRFDFTYSSPQATPLSTRHSLSALPSDESVEPSGPYPELVGCLMYLMTCTRPDLAYPLSILARYVAPGRHRPEHMAAAKRVLRYLCSTLGMGLVLGGRRPVVLTGHADTSWADDQATQRSSQGYTFSLGSGSVSWRSTRSSSVLSSSCEAEIYAGAMAAQELRWLTYLLTNLGEQPRSPPVLYVDNKAMLALCREHRLEHRTKHIALRYFLARELQQRGQLRLAYVASEANTADIFTKALAPGDHQRFCTLLACFALLCLTGLVTSYAVEPVEVAVDSGAGLGGTKPERAEPGGAGLGGAEPERAEPGGAGSGGAEPGVVESGGAEPDGAGPGGPSGALSRRELPSPQELHEWFARRWSRPAGAGNAAGAGGSTAAGGAGATGPGGAHTGGTRAAGPGGALGAGASGGAGAGSGAGVGATGGTGAGATASSGGPAGAGAARGSGAGGAAGGGTPVGAGVGATGAAGAGGAAGVGADAGGAGAVSAGSGGAAWSRPYFIPLLEQMLGLPPSSGPTPSLECPPPVQSESQLQLASLLPAPSPYAGPTGGLAERREPESRPTSLVRAARTSRHVPRQRLPAVPGMHHMALRPSTAPQRVFLPSPPESSLPALADSESDSLRAATPTVMRFLATVVTDPSFESTAASALVAKLVDFAAHCRLDYAASLVAESESICPPSVGGECALSTDVLEDRHEEFLCFTAALPHLLSMLLAPEGDPDALDIPTPRSYAEAIEGTYVDEVPPPGANIISGMWIFRVKRPPGSPPVFKARYVARGFSQRQGVDYFQTFSPTPKMTILRGSLHEEIWLRRPPGFTRSFPPGTQWSLRRPVYGLRQAPREWHDTLRTTLAALGFAPSTADPSLFLRTDTLLPPFYILVYVDDLVFATVDTAGLAHVKSELQKRHTCTDLGELRSYLGLQITQDRARRTITLTQSHMVHHVLQRFDFTYSSPQATPLSTRHSLSALPSDESVEPSGPYPELVGCLMYLMTCTRPDLAYPLSILARYVAPGRHRREHMAAAKRVLCFLCSTSGMGLVLRGRSPVVLTGHADASSCEAEIYAGAMAAEELRWLTYLLIDLREPPHSPPILYVDNKALCQEHRLEHRTKHIALRYFLARELQQRGQLRLAYVASQANTADIFTKALQPCDHQRFCTMLVKKLLGSGGLALTLMLLLLLVRLLLALTTNATTAPSSPTAAAAASTAPSASAAPTTTSTATTPTTTPTTSTSLAACTTATSTATPTAPATPAAPAAATLPTVKKEKKE